MDPESAHRQQIDGIPGIAFAEQDRRARHGYRLQMCNELCKGEAIETREEIHLREQVGVFYIYGLHNWMVPPGRLVSALGPDLVGLGYGLAKQNMLNYFDK